MTNICFSATASFGAGIALLAAGAITVRRTSGPQELPLAAIPAIFGVQQLVEGCLWLTLPGPTATTDALTVIFLLFSHVVWPALVPLAIWLIEPSAIHRRRIAWPMAAGVAVGAFFLVMIVTNPVSATISGMHIRYRLPHPAEEAAFAAYAVATCLAPLLSSHRTVRLFGAGILASMIVAAIVYAVWFASVWCFFAALVSGIVILHFSGRRRHGSDTAVIRPG